MPLAAEQLTVVSFGGSYARASQQAYHEPFTAETGIEVRLEDYNGGLAQIRAQVETGNVHWDVVALNVADAVLGCDEGLLEFIDPGDLPPGADGSSVEDDFVPGTLTDCGMGTRGAICPVVSRFSITRNPWRSNSYRSISFMLVLRECGRRPCWRS